jgi:outer membrane protein insertion porin family
LNNFSQRTSTQITIQTLILMLSLIFHLGIARAQSEPVSAPAPEAPIVSSPDAENSASDVTGAPGIADESDRDPAQTKKKKPTIRRVKGRAAAARPAADDVSGLKVGKIDVKGNKKIEVDAVVARLVSKPGEPYTAEKIRSDVDALFRTGYFYDVRVDRNVSGGNADLVYTVVEKPSVVEIIYRGNSEVETNDLTEATGLKAFEILNMTKIKEATDKMQKLYEDKGFFLAHINPIVENVTAGESVKLIFDIQENDKVKVKRVTFLGNRNIGDGKLKTAMQTQEGGFFSFISGSGAYKQDAFDRDMQLIQYLYFNEGYVTVKVDRPQVYVTPDKKGIYITIRVDEGERYKIGTIDFAGDLLFDRDELFNSVEIDNKEWYSHETLLKDLRTLQAKYGDLGYAYANPIPRTRTRDKDKQIDITFELDKGNKVYFGRFNVTGNTKTRDKVVRRELQIREGELYNETRKRESMENVKRLGYFEDVQFNSKTPADNPDAMDLDIVVKERNTGTIQVGAGYSTYSQFIFNGQVNQINLFGKGQKLGISVDLSKNQSLFNLNFTEPFFLDTRWSLGFDAYKSTRTLTEYVEQKTGGAIRVGHPLAPFLNGTVRYKLDQTQIDLDSNFGDPQLFPTATANGLTSSVTGILEYDKRNDRFAPTDGVYSSVSLEYAGLGGDKRYTKGFFTGRFYKKTFWDIVFRNNLAYGFIRANNPGEQPPFNELFLLGGANSLRGYDWYSIGKRIKSAKRFNCLTGQDPDPNSHCVPGTAGTLDPNSSTAEQRSRVPFGGTQQLYYQAELEFPLITEAGIKGVVFYDVGEAQDDLSLDPEVLRQDFGFGFRWFSPIGPLRFEWGFPIGRKTELDERAVNFQFAIGTPF